MELRRGWIIAVLLLTGMAMADTPRIRHARLGLGNQYRDRSWNMLEVDVENPGDEQSAMLVFECGGRQSGQLLLHRRSLNLLPHSIYHYRFPVYMDFGVAAISSKEREVRPTGLVRLTDGGRMEWDRFEVLAQATTPSRIHFLSATEPFVSFNLLRELTIDGRKTSCVRTPVRTRDLPRDALALRPFDVVVLGDEADQPMDALQLDALKVWVDQGGLLVFAPGPKATLDTLRSWAPLLPAVYGSGVVVDRMPDLPVFKGPAFYAKEGIFRRRLFARDGKVCMGRPEDPLAVSWTVGNGRVMALAFDPAATDFQRWEGASDFWSSLMEWPSPLNRYALRLAEQDHALQSIMANLAGVRVLDRRRITRYLSAVVILLAGVLLGARFTRYPEWGWALAVFCAALIGVGAIAAASAFKGEATAFINEIGIVRAGVRGLPSVQAAVSVFSPQDATFSLFPGTSDLALQPGPSETRPPELFTLHAARPPTVPGLQVRAHGVRHLLAEGRLPERALPEIEVRVTAQGLHCRVLNKTGDAMDDAFLRWNRLIVAMGDTPRGQESSEYAMAARGPSGATYSRRVVRQPMDEWRDRVRSLFFMEGWTQELPSLALSRFLPPLPLEAEWEKPVLYYWSHEPVLPLVHEPDADRRSILLWAVHAPIQYDRGDLLLPKGLLLIESRRRTPGVHRGNLSRFQGVFPERLLLAYRLPEGCPDLEVTQLRVFADFEAAGYYCALGLVPADKQALADPPAEPLSGHGPVYAMADPTRFYDRNSRSVLLSATIVKKDESFESEGKIHNQWFLRELDIELAGHTL